MFAYILENMIMATQSSYMFNFNDSLKQHSKSIVMLQKDTLPRNIYYNITSVLHSNRIKQAFI